MHTLFRNILFISISLPVLTTGLAGCDKEGAAIQESLETNINFSALTVDTLRLAIKIDDEVVNNNFIVPYIPSPTGAGFTWHVRYFDRNNKVTIYNVADNRVLFDSSFVFDKASLNVSLYQKNSGQPFTYIAPPTGESLPPKDYGKISFNYTLAGLPDMVKAVVENSTIPGGLTYSATDSFILKKGDFSPFFLSRLGSKRANVYLYTSDAARKQVGLITANEISAAMNAGFTIYTVREFTSYVNGIYEVRLEKLY
jgi:hypothetical protein